MGVVYKAHDPVLDRLVAIKQMSADISSDPQLRQRFSQEARAAARLNHRNIVTIYELEDDDTEICIVMELLEGVDLATLIKRQAVLSIATRVDIMAQVCDGLGYAHRAGIIHRDIKPGNLHVTPEGVVKILDFGIARLASSHMTRTGGLVGTPNYMSPEQITGSPIDARSDIFAVGAVLYELLSGTRPFDADSMTAVLFKIVQAPHEPLRSRAPDLPDALIEVVERALAKNPDDRPSTAFEMRAILLSIAGGPEGPGDFEVTRMIPVPGSGDSPGTDRPGSQSSAGGSENEARLASLALDHGRELRRTGDLGAAMKVLRSVLEIAPGNMDAAQAVAELEDEIAKKLASTPGRITGPSEMAAPVVPRPPTVRPAPKSPVAPRPQSTKTPWFVAAVVVLLAAAAIAGVRMLRARRANAPPPSVPVAVVTPAPVTQTPPPPPVDTPPAPAAAADATPAAPESPVAAPPAGAPVTPAPAAPRPAPRRRAEPARPAPAPAPEPEPAPPPPPAALPSAPVLPPTAPAAVAPAPTPSLIVYHLHGRFRLFGGGRKKGDDYAKDSCEGAMQLLPEGMRFKTTAPCPDTKENEEKQFLFRNIKKVSLEDERLRIEAEDKNWDFVGPPDALGRIEQHVRAGKQKP